MTAVAAGQQLDRKLDQACGPGALELVVRRQLARGPAGGRRDEPDPVSAHERARPLCLSQGCADPAAHAQGQPD